MSPKAASTEPPPARGLMLLEAMVGMALVGLVVAASVYASGRGSNLQARSEIRGQAVQQLHALLLSQGVTLCTATSIPAVTINGQSYTVSVAKTAPYCQPYSAVTVTLPGQSATAVSLPATLAAPLSISINAVALGGVLSLSSD